MRPLLVCTTGLLVLAVSVPAQEGKPTSDLQKISYSLGADIGKNFRMQEMQLDVDMMARGIRDGFGGGECQLTDAEMEKTIEAFQQIMMEKAKQKAMADSYENRKIGEEFLAENKKKDGVVALPSGLQYKILKDATGPKPGPSAEVTVNYRGTLINGKEFDSSFKRNEPTTFSLDRVIRGWSEGLRLMSVGAKYQFFVPSELAYGDRQMGPDIGPGSTLIFEVELLDIKK